MNRATNGLYHAFVGNDAPPEATGLTRGIVAAGVAGMVNAILLCVPLGDTLRAELMAALSPTVTLLSYVLYGYMDRVVKG